MIPRISPTVARRRSAGDDLQSPRSRERDDPSFLTARPRQHGAGPGEAIGAVKPLYRRNHIGDCALTFAIFGQLRTRLSAGGRRRNALLAPLSPRAGVLA